MRLAALGYTFISICLWPSKVVAAIVNGTIDDKFGDSVTHRLVNYYPNNYWFNETCGCDADVPDKSQAFDNTYTVGTYIGTEPIGISIQFSGTAIYVFFILGAVTFPTSLNSANFTLDNNDPVLFSSQVTGIQYNVTVFSKTNLTNTLHTLNIVNSGPLVPTYVIFDYAIYTYDDGVSTTSSSLSSLSAVKTTSQAPSTTVTGAPARRTPVGAIAGGIVGGITLFALVISLLFCWHRRGGHDALQNVRGKGGPESPITQFNNGAGSLAASAFGMPYTQPLLVRSETPMPGESSSTDHRANMHNNYRTLHSGEVVLSPPGSQQLPSSEKALPSTSKSSVFGTSSNNRSAPPLLPSPLNVPGTREEVRRARQEDLDNRLRVVQHNIVQLEESSTGPGRPVSSRRQTSGEAEIIEEEMQMSMPDMQEEIRSLKEQIRVLRQQQQSAWAQGLSDDRPPGYTPMEGMQIPGEASS